MAQLTTQKTQATRSTRRPAEPGWLWFLLVGGSVAAHLLAVALILPFVGRAAPREAAIDAAPVDFVELPANPAPVETVAKPVEPAPTTAPPPTQAAPPTEVAPSDISVVLPSTPPAIDPAPPEPNAPASAVASPAPESPTPESPTPESPAPESPAPTEPMPPAETQPPEPQPTEPQSAATQPTETPPAETQSPEPQPTAAAQPSTLPTEPQPAAPLIVTERIDRAVPDVSETLPIDPTPPTPLAQVNTDREAQPITLVASLQAADVPPEQLETPPPDTIAQPGDVVDGISRRSFVSDPQASACIPDVASIPAIGSGAQVAVQVGTDAAGQVVETAVLQPSQNPAYDQLAVCLVEQWSFQPATAQGQPVPSRALVVWVRIDRG
ncbi:TonB family protein [Phormidium tenue FACHB-886]|nr:TonB family protein [Phormidium tenue FACHB-886]